MNLHSTLPMSITLSCSPRLVPVMKEYRVPVPTLSIVAIIPTEQIFSNSRGEHSLFHILRHLAFHNDIVRYTQSLSLVTHISSKHLDLHYYMDSNSKCVDKDACFLVLMGAFLYIRRFFIFTKDFLSTFLIDNLYEVSHVIIYFSCIYSFDYTVTLQYE